MDSWPKNSLLSILSLPYKQIFDAMPGYALIVSADFFIVECNRRVLEDFGDIRGRRCFDVLQHRTEICGGCHVEMTLHDGLPHRFEQRIEKPDGEVVHVIANTVPIKNSDDQVAAIMIMYNDVTLIYNLKEELKQSEKRYRDLFEKVPCYISVQDPDLRIVAMNEAFRVDFNAREGTCCYETYKHREEPCMICPVLETFQDGQDHIREEVVTNIYGDKLNVLVHSHPIRNDAGKVEYVMEMSSNITQIRLLQDQLQSLGLLVGSISHGIKGVLTGLDGGIYMMNSGFQSDNMDRIKKGWDMIQRNVARIRSMVMDMLYYAKDREPNREPVDPAQVLTDVCDLLAQKAKDQNIEFIRSLDAGATPFEADSKALHSMLVNVLENSIDACRTDKNKERHWIKAGLRADEDHVIFEVSDNGVGMDRETRDRLFSLFFSSKGSEGTGLGLFISNKIAQQHGGAIVVDSEPGKGSHFSIRIPRRFCEERKRPEAAIR